MDAKLSGYSSVETNMLVSREGEAPADLSSEALAKAELRRTGPALHKLGEGGRSALHEFPQEIAGQGAFG